MSDSVMNTLTCIISTKSHSKPMRKILSFLLMNEEIESGSLIFPSLQLLVTDRANSVLTGSKTCALSCSARQCEI